MKTTRYLPLALVLTIPSLALADYEYEGVVNLGVRTTHYASDQKSAKYDEYTDESNGLFGSGWFLLNAEEYTLRASLDAAGAQLTGEKYGLLKGRLYYNYFTHNLYYDARSPATGIGSDYLVVPEPALVPDVSDWTEFDYDIDRKFIGGEVTVDQQDSPFYYKLSYEQQRSDGIMPYGTTYFTDFELPMPIDYTTNIVTAESGYRSRETTVVLGASYSDFDNDNDVLTITNGVEDQEYSMPSDNYSYTINGRLRQQLPMDSLLAMKASYTRNKSSTDFDDFTTLVSPTADGDFDGDVQYIRLGAAVTTRLNNAMDTRLYYDYVDRNNDSDEITAVNDRNGDLEENDLYEYHKNQAGLDFNYRFNRANKLNSGYQFTRMDQSRDDADSSNDNLLFAQLKNTSLEWMSTKVRLEYLNRDTDSDYSAEDLEGDGLIHEYFTAWDWASKDRYKAKLSLEFYPADGLDLGLSYAFVYDDYDATQLGVQDDRRHEVYADASLQLRSKIKFNTYVGYEYTESNLDSRRFNPGNPDPSLPPDSSNYNWHQETTYDFFTVGGSVTVPILHNLDMVMSADYQVVDGNIDFSRPAAAGDPLEPINDADDYYKTQLGIKAIYKATEAISCTVGYTYEKSNLNDWEYDNWDYNPGSSYYMTGAGLDNDYEAHQFYLIGSYRF